MVQNRNVKNPTDAGQAIDLWKVDLESDPNAGALTTSANRYLQLPTLATGELVAAGTAGNGVLVYDTTANALKASINGSYVSLGAGGASNAFLTVACGAGTNPVADAATDTLTLTGTEITVTGDSATDTATFSITALAVTAAKLATTLDISGKTLTLPTSQTLTTPTIASFVNANHDHSNAAGGGTLSTPSLAGTTASVFTFDSDNVAAAKVAINTNSATGAWTATIVPPNLSADATITLPAVTATLATIGGTETLTAKTLTAPVINGATSSGSTALNFGGNSGAFTTSTGTNTLSGDVAIPANKTFTQTGSGTFATGTGNISLNGDVAIASGKDLGMSGASTFDTGTGAIGLNGDVTIATTKALNLGTGSAIGGAVNIYRDGAGAKSVAIVPGTSITLVDNVVQVGAYTFGTGTGAVSLNGDVTIAAGKNLVTTTGAVSLGAGAISTTYATMVTNLNSDKVDGKHSADFASPAYINFGVSGALGAATVYPHLGVEAADTTEDGFFIAPTNGTLTKMYTKVVTAPGGADTVVYTVRIGGVDKTITCTTTGAGTTSNDTAHTEAVSAGELVSVKAVSSAATAADASITLEFQTKIN